MSNTALCTAEALESAKAASTPWYLSLQAFQVFCCLLAIVFNKMVAFIAALARVPDNFKTLYKYYRVNVYVFCFFFSLSQTYHLISRLFFTGCDLLIPACFCILCRIFQSFASVYFQLFFVGVTVDLGFNHFNLRYRASKHAANCIAGLTAALAFIAVGPSFPKDIKSDALLANCASLENKSKSTQRNIFIWFFFLEAVTLLTFIGLAVWQRYDLRKYRNRYRVSRRYQHAAMRRIMLMLLPNLIAHLCAYCYSNIRSVYYTTEENVNALNFLESFVALPLFLLISPIISMISLKPLTKPVNSVAPNVDVNTYFANLDKEWNSSYEDYYPNRSLKTLKRSNKVESICPGNPFITKNSQVVDN